MDAVPRARGALVAAALFTGLFAGLMCAFIIAVDRALALLPAPAYAQMMQHLIRSADVPPTVPGIVVAALVAPAVALIQMRRAARTAAFRLTLAGFVLFFAGAFLVTVLFNVRINNAILGWDANAPPSDWAAARERWHALNLPRTGASVAAFVCYLLALARTGDDTGGKENGGG